MKSRFASYGLAAALVLTAAGCAAPMATSPATSKAPSAGTTTTPGSAAAPGAAKGSGTIGAGGGTVSNNAGGAISNNAGGLISNNPEAPRPGASAAPATSADSGAGAGFAPGEPNPGMPPAQEVTQEALKAGAVDDNAKFADYLAYVKDFVFGGDMNPVARPRLLDVTDRHVIRVVDSAGKGVANASVSIKAGEVEVAQVTTYADGRALFHASAYEGLDQTAQFTLAATKGVLATSATGEAADPEWEVAFESTVDRPAAKLDMAIVIDTTGSMSGEIKKFQTTIASIASRVQALPQQPSVRLGLVAYKDRGEQYVSKVIAPFTTDVPAFQTGLDMLTAGGGADKPEDLEAALGDTVNTLAWDPGDAVRLSFVVTDAAAHTDYEQNTPYTDSMKLAASKGIKLYPIGASSLEPEGEYALRQLAQWTMGQYLFVTRGGDEATGGGGTASATVDKFREGRLDDIVVDIVKAELDKLGK